MQTVEYHLLLRLPVDQLLEPEDIEAMSPFISVHQAPSEYEIARARGLLRKHMFQPSLSPAQLQHKLGGSLHDVRFEAMSGEQFVLREVLGSSTRYQLEETTGSGLMTHPEILTLAEVIAVLDYCGGLNA